MDAKMCCLEKLINIIHCDKYNQFKNIIITNMKDNYIYKYDDIKGLNGNSKLLYYVIFIIKIT